MIVYGAHSTSSTSLVRCLSKKKLARNSRQRAGDVPDDDQRLRLYLGGIVSGKVVEMYTQNGITDGRPYG